MNSNGAQESNYVDDRENLAEMLNDCSIDRVMAIDYNWKIIAWNRTSEIISGISRNELIGKRLLDAFPQILQDPEMLKAIQDALNGRKSFLPANSTSFNRTYSENHFIPLKNHDGFVIGVMNIMHDVTHRIKTEKQLRNLNGELQKKFHQLEKANRELATFTQITSHDIKEPLKHVYTSLELLVKKEGHTLTNMSKGNLRRMQGSLNKMNLLLDDILTVAGISNNEEQPQEIDVKEILQKNIQKLQNKLAERNAKIRLAKIFTVYGYPKMLDILIYHLLDNAIKFQPDDGLPLVEIDMHEMDGYDIEMEDVSEDKTYTVISVTDNGLGFNQEDEEKMFRMFERLHGREYHGSGIGLTLCKKIVELHDGFIRALSSPGSGSTFAVYLPNGER